MKKLTFNKTKRNLRWMLLIAFLLILGIGVAFKIIEYNNNGQPLLMHSGSRAFFLEGNSIIIFSFIVFGLFLFILKKEKM